MVHILSNQRREEFLSGNCIARFEMCMDDDIGRPTLYIKSGIIDLYFVTKNDCLTLDILNVDNDLIVYIISVDEGEKTPLYLYSSIETLSEKHALESIALGSQFDVILFNDFAIEIARATGLYHGTSLSNKHLKTFSPKGPDFLGVNANRVSTAVSAYLDGEGIVGTGCLALSNFESASTSILISDGGESMKIHGFTSATLVHESLPQIITDHTSLKFVHSPNVEVSSDKTREFSDAIILGADALLSFQAKCFDFEGDILPTKRSNAEKRMQKNIKKAISQTKGSSRMIRQGKTILSNGVAIDIPPETRITFGIFIPSLDLVSSELQSELVGLGEQLIDYEQNLVVLDPMQFLRTIQAAENVFHRLDCSIDEAFFILIERNSQDAINTGIYSRQILYRW